MGKSVDAHSVFRDVHLTSLLGTDKVHENDRHKTTFGKHKVLYLFKVMPFGLTYSPATFERLIKTELIGLQWERCLVYLFDVIVFRIPFKETLSNLIKVLDRFTCKDANFKLSR